jgi:polysaccharide pyruvyl transferase WcaK-like protein
MRNGWVNTYSEKEFEALFLSAGYSCLKRLQWRDQQIFCFVQGGEDDRWSSVGLAEVGAAGTLTEPTVVIAMTSESFPVPPTVRLNTSVARAHIKAERWGNALAQHVFSPTLAVVGCYDTGNIGDLALGWTLRALVRSQGLPATLQPLSAIECFPTASNTIVGGGGILTVHPRSPLHRLAARYASRAPHVALVGVSGTLTSDECNPSLRRFLSAVPFFSVRSQLERDELSGAIGRSDISVHPDVAFGLLKALRPRVRQPMSNLLGVNVSPFLFHYNGRTFSVNNTPTAWFKRHLPEEAEVYGQIADSYVDVLRATLRAYIDRGWEVRLIPFAIEDYAFARSIFRTERVEFLPYSQNPVAVFETLTECSRFIATRYHSHVFALTAGVPCLSVAYAPKCRLLWDELGLPAYAKLGPLDLVRRKQYAIEVLRTAKPAVLEATRRSAIQDQAICGCLHAVRDNHGR